jgi:hypothetical protein
MESPKETSLRLQREASLAFQQWQESLHPPLGPDSEVWVHHTLVIYKKMTIADLARQIRIPVDHLIVNGSIKDAGCVVEKNSEWIDIISLPEEEDWKVDDDFWAVSEVSNE